jgi:transcriptional regulator with XRE-family HTH domain
MMSIKFPNPTDKYVGSRVRMRRLMLHMSQERLADQLGLTFQQVQKYEKGTNRISASRLQEISHILEVPVPFFFEGAPHASGSARKTGEGPSLAYITDFLGTADGHALVRAFIKIKDTGLRRSVVRLVEAIVASGDS